MAENKKGFVLYADILHTVKHLTDEQAGKLFKHVLSYVNDEDPKSEDPIVNIAFEPIKQQLKRDLEKWETIRKKRSEAGQKSAEARKNKGTNSTSVKSVKQTLTNSTVNDNVNVTVTVNDNVKENVINNNSLLERENKFRLALSKFRGEFSDDLLKSFFDYWTEPNKSKTKMKFEQQKTWDLGRRLKRWASNDFNKPKDSGNNSRDFQQPTEFETSL